MQSGDLRMAAQAAPHSRVFAACHTGASGNPWTIGTAANRDVSLDRPARTTSAPSSRALAMGSGPIIPTM